MRTYDLLLNDFTAKHDLRHAMMLPSLKDGFVYATNGHVAIKIPVNKLASIYSPVEDYPNVEGAFASAQLLEKPLSINFHSIDKTLSSIEKINIYEDCSECEGTGEVECECCGNSTECSTCRGSGNTGKLIGWDYGTTENIKLGEGFFKATYLRLLINVCMTTVCDTVIVKALSKKNAALFKINDVDVIVMPVFVSHEAEKVLEIKTSEETEVSL